MHDPKLNRNERTTHGCDGLGGASGADAPSLIERLCQERRIRLTGQRRAIARVLSETADSPDAEEVHRRAARLDPRVSLSTVYRALRLFEHKGVLKRWTPSRAIGRGGSQNGRSRGRGCCEPADAPPRHRLVDIETGATFVFQDAALDLLLAELAARLGFRLLDQRLELFGIREDGPTKSVPAATSSPAGEAPWVGLVTDDPRQARLRAGGRRSARPISLCRPTRRAHAGAPEPNRTHQPQGRTSMRIRPLAEALAVFLGTDSSAALEECEALDAHFRWLTERGNRALEVSDEATASRLYTEAINEAERLFELAMTTGGPSILLAPMVHNIACHNAAQARKRARDGVGALALQVRALERLVTTAESAASPLAMRVNCVRHLKYALASLAEDLTGREPDKGSIQALVARAGPVTAEVMRIAELALATKVTSEPAPLHSDARTCQRVLS